MGLLQLKICTKSLLSIGLILPAGFGPSNDAPIRNVEDVKASAARPDCLKFAKLFLKFKKSDLSIKYLLIADRALITIVP